VITTLSRAVTLTRMEYIIFLLMFVGLCGWLGNWASK
jgi:hypothetical protein